MSTSQPSSPRSAACRTALFAFACACTLALTPAQAVKAADTAAPAAPAVKAPSLPVTATFDKVANAERGPYVLKVTNNAKDTLKVSAKILLSVAFHMGSKHWDLPEQAIEPGKAWTIPDLTAGDKVTLLAQGYAPLELVVPQGTPNAAM
ncbi:MAG TPA: hypothetical protein VLW52_03695 [Opitutaceae bacterium]|nr:hypothetical protein [Opitutaceae bacterium]